MKKLRIILFGILAVLLTAITYSFISFTHQKKEEDPADDWSSQMEQLIQEQKEQDEEEIDRKISGEGADGEPASTENPESASDERQETDLKEQTQTDYQEQETQGDKSQENNNRQPDTQNVQDKIPDLEKTVEQPVENAEKNSINHTTDGDKETEKKNTLQPEGGNTNIDFESVIDGIDSHLDSMEDDIEHSIESQIENSLKK